MASGNFSGEEHPHQHFNCCCSDASVTITQPTFEKEFSITEIQNTLNQLLNLLQNTALPPSTRECCCKGVTNFGELKWMPDFITYLKPSIGEEVEKALIRVLGPNLHSLQRRVLPPNSSSSLPYHSKSSMPGCYQLSFKGELPNELLTKNKIEEEGASVEVELLDEFGKRVEVGLDSGVKIKVDVLDGDFDAEDRNDWTEEDYKRYIVRPRKDRGPLLKGNSQFSLDGGVAGVCGFSFTDNSKSMRNGKFRFGAQVIGSLPSGGVVRSAVSKKAFQVKENRLKSDRKHSTPSLEDNLWRLRNINRTGAFYGRATEKNIHTVKDFLQLYHTDEKKLKDILKIPETKWVEIVKNAKECKLTNEHYQYYDDASGNALILDCAFNIKSVTFKGRTTQLYESLDFTHKENADKLRQSAYEKRNNLEIYDDFTNKVPTQGLEYPCSALQQEEEEQDQLVAAPPPSNNPSVGSFSQNMVASTSSQIYSNSPVPHPDTAGTYQDEVLPVQAPNHGIDSLVFDSENDSPIYLDYLDNFANWGPNMEFTADSACSMAGFFGDNNPSFEVNIPQQISGHRLDSPTSLPPEKCPASYPCPNMPFFPDETGMQQVNCCASNTLSSNSHFKVPADLLAKEEACLGDSWVSSNPAELMIKTPSTWWVYWRKIRVKLILVTIRVDSCRPLKKQKAGPLLK